MRFLLGMTVGVWLAAGVFAFSWLASAKFVSTPAPACSAAMEVRL